MAGPAPIRSVLAGVGAYLPPGIVTNADLSRRVDTTDEWIRTRTGIGERRIAAPEETCAAIATHAARAALADAGATAAEVGAIILATSTPDQAFPATAVRVQAALGMTHGFGFDVAAACSGFIYALAVADGMIRAGQIGSALVIGAEVFSRLLDWNDRATCVLFGDGAGAILLRADSTGTARGVLSTHLHSDGTLGDLLYVNGAVGRPHLPGTIVMQGREIFRHAVTKLSDSVLEALAANHLTGTDVNWLVPHQANLRIIDAMAKRLDLPSERVVITVDRHANTSAASIPLALAEAWHDHRIQPGQLILMEALGGGLTWGSALLRV